MTMRLIEFERLTIAPELARTRGNKSFDERLRASIERIGLIEPIKVARSGDDYVIVDGILRWRAIEAIRSDDADRFKVVPSYVVDFARRFEIRFQTDIYQDLLPSQLAELVELLHERDGVAKNEIAAYLGVSAATLRNYTGLWRLMQRGGLFRRVVHLMDAGVLPASNPYAWLRLTEEGLSQVIRTSLAGGRDPEEWVEAQLSETTRSAVRRLALKEVETATGTLPSRFYREGEETRAKKKALGRRRGQNATTGSRLMSKALQNLDDVERETNDPVLRIAAQSLREFVA